MTGHVESSLQLNAVASVVKKQFMVRVQQLLYRAAVQRETYACAVMHLRCNTQYDGAQPPLQSWGKGVV